MTYMLHSDPNYEYHWSESTWWENFDYHVFAWLESIHGTHNRNLDEWLPAVNLLLKPYDAVYQEDRENHSWSLTFLDEESYLAFVLEWS
jgi:hypothetical protein